MISHISGKLDHIDGNRVIVDVGGVGYAVHAPASFLLKPPRPGESVKLFTCQVVREDAIALFGFPTKKERKLFSTLLSVNGVGPKAALSIISEIPLDKLVTGIAEGNAELISRVKGIGRKTAEKVIIELKEKVARAHAIEAGKTGTIQAENPGVKDAISALMTLGYSSSEAKKAIEQSGVNLSENPAVERIIKKALSALV